MYLNVMFMPHPPIIMDSIGGMEREKARCTVEGMFVLANKISKLRPETIIFISPHGNSFSNGTCILAEEDLVGDFSQFGHSEIRLNKKVNMELSKMIYECIEDRNYTAVYLDDRLADSYGVSATLDHGAMVPMYFIDMYYTDYNIVHITPGNTPLEENYFLGKLIKDMVDQYTDEHPSKVLVVSSGDLSHALSSQGPYAFHPNGPKFDEIMKDAICKADPMELLKLDYGFIAGAAQCGLRSYLMGFGFMDGLDYRSKVVSYEGPFGVGYLTGYLESDMVIAEKSVTRNRGKVDGNTEMSHIPTIQDIMNERYSHRVELEDDYIHLARKTIEHFVKTHTKYEIEEEEFSKGFLEDAKNRKGGAFVSLHKDAKLRGCIGTTEATNPNLLDEIIYNAISACSADPRFHPVEESELKDLEIKVDILHPYEAIDSAKDLDVKKYGVIVEQGYKRGLLLPNLEGINRVEEQVSIAKQKAGIIRGAVKLYRFEVERHEIED